MRCSTAWLRGEAYKSAAVRAYQGIHKRTVVNEENLVDVYGACEGLCVQSRYDDYIHYSQKVNAQEAVCGCLAASSIPYVQLTLEDAFGSAAPSESRLNVGYAARIRRLFEQNDVGIAVLSCYINPVHPNLGVRRAQLNKFRTYVQYARDFGCSIVATETGSLLPDLSYVPRNHGDAAMKMLLESLGELVQEAECRGVTVAIEGVHKFVASDPDRIREILSAIPSNHLQVILDPVNLMRRGQANDIMRLAEESFLYYGSRIAAVHAKDVLVSKENGARLVPVGQGVLDWGRIAELCVRYKPWIPIVLEESSPATMAEELMTRDTAFAASDEREVDEHEEL